MQNGLKDKINVAFLTKNSKTWLGGVNYFKNLFTAISLVNNPQINIFTFDSKDKTAKKVLKNFKLTYLKKDFRYRLDKFVTCFLKKDFDKNDYFFKRYKIDIASHTFIDTNSIPVVTWIPDFQHIHLKEMFTEEELKFRDESFQLQTKKSSLVILSSNDALEDFKAFAPGYAEKGRVLRFVSIPDKNIYSKTDKIKNKVIEKYKLPEKYFYVPNQFWKHKNHKVILKAISILKKQGLNIKVIFTGNTSDYRNLKHFEELTNYIKQEGIQDNVNILGIVDLIEVYYFMRNCVSIINPSKFEGWSSTVEEAKSIGKNIILSDLNVHKEQNPPEGIFFNPDNAEELANILKSKWETKNSEPDYELEEQAKKLLPTRILEFGKQYQNILMEVLNKS